MVKLSLDMELNQVRRGSNIEFPTIETALIHLGETFPKEEFPNGWLSRSGTDELGKFLCVTCSIYITVKQNDIKVRRWSPSVFYGHLTESGFLGKEMIEGKAYYTNRWYDSQV